MYQAVRKLKHAGKNPFLYLMALPGLLFFVLFSYLPMYGVLIAFKNFNISKGVWNSPSIGFDNFEFFFTSSQLFKVIRNTLSLNVLFIVVTTIVALALAILINEIRLRWLQRLSQ